MTDSPPVATKRARYSETQKAQAVALAALNGPEQAGEELGIDRRRVGEWLRETSSADIRLYVQQKALEAAAGVADRLPGLLELAVERTEQTLRDDTVKWNGTQLQALHTGLAILADKVLLLKDSGAGQGRFGTHSSGAGVLDLDDQALEAIRRTGRG